MTPEYCELDAEGDVILILERCHEKDDVQPAAKKAVSGECESKSQIQSEQIRMRVSSKHLTLASNVFRTLFRGSFQEGVTLRTKGTVEIPLPDDHPTALLILLNIVHGHTRRVPRQVDFRMLTQIAILVDKYQCHEAVEMFTDSWCQRVAGAMPQSFTDDLMPAVCVYWVFGQPAEFKHVTQLAQTESKSAISEKVLPIPSRIIDKINRDREEALSKCFAVLEDLLGKYQNASFQCHHGADCNAMTLGGLIIRLKSMGCFPLPGHPYEGFSFKALSQQLCNLSAPTLCDLKRCCYHHNNLCHTKPIISAPIEKIQDYLVGLDLERFRPTVDS